MSIQSKSFLKSKFESGDKPTQQDFIDLIDSSNVPTVISIGETSGNVLTDASAADTFELTATNPITLSHPTNATDGKTITWIITQGGVGNNNISLATSFVVPSSAGTPLNFSTEAGKTDILTARYCASANKWLVVAMIPGYML